MRKALAALVACAATLTFSTATAQTMIASFDDAALWTVHGNDIDVNSATAGIEVDAVDYTQGLGAIAFSYDYSGIAHYEVGITKTFDPPIDLTDAAEFMIDVKGDASSQADLQWYAVMTDVYGQSIKYYLGSSYTDPGGTVPVHRPKDGEWNTYTFSLAELVWQEWGNVAYRAPSLSDVESVTFYLQQVSGIEDSGSTTVLVDNWRYNTTTNRMVTEVVEQFDYANTAALLDVWSVNYSGGPGSEAQSEATLNTTNVFAGTGAMQLDFNLVEGAQNFSTGQRWPLAESWDITGLVDNTVVFEVAIAGDPDIPETADLMLAFQDSAGNRARWRLRNGLRTSEYDRFPLFTRQDAPTQWGAVNAWEEEVWDAGGDLDKSDVSLIVVYMIDGGTVYPWTGSALVDNLVYHVPTGEDPVESPAEITSARNWTIYH